MLKNFLDQFNFSYSFKSSTQLYKSGYFNETLILILKNYKNIMDIIIPTLGKERQKTYSPFLPICPDSGKVLEIPIIEIDEKNSKIIFDNSGKKLEMLGQHSKGHGNKNVFFSQIPSQSTRGTKAITGMQFSR